MNKKLLRKILCLSLSARKGRLRLSILPLLVLAFIASLLFADSGRPQISNPVIIKGAYQSVPVEPHISDTDLRKLPKTKVWRMSDPIVEIPRRTYPRQKDFSPQPDTQLQDPVLDLQRNSSHDLSFHLFSIPDFNFDGQGFSGVFPPDTVGDIGINHYIQMINGSGGAIVTVYDKTVGSIVAGPFDLDSLWIAGGSCASGFGDPIVLYDVMANRWLMSELAKLGNHLCVYISRTPDPVSGGWFLYDFNVPEFPDYPKYAVWSDAYYVSSNESNPAAYALDRIKMLQGQAASFQRFTAPSLPAFSFQAFTPGDLDGSTPPLAGSPNYFVRHRDGEANGDPPNPNNDTLEIWEFKVDWNNPANSTFAGPTNILVSEFDSDLCGFISFSCFPQPNTTQRLDPLREVVMHRLQYRNFGDHETLVGNFVTDVNKLDHGGIRWFELRKTQGGSWALFQEGSYAPDQAHRWMGSIAMDQLGNIALGYSITSPELNIFPSIRYSGRLAGDPSGTLPQGEFTLANGAGAQTVSSRWGDYSSMNVDPQDDCTFWYTTEYMLASGLWQTRIGSFKFQLCKQGGTIPDIKLNGLDGAITLTPIDNISATIKLVSGANSGKNADWWVFVKAPSDLFHFDFGSGLWQPGLSVTHQGPLSDVGPFTILNASGLPAGSYTLYFGVDLNMNGQLDPNQFLFDTVILNICC